MDKETEKNLQEIQVIEQNLQNFLMQKQAFQFELNETESALEEIKKSEGEIYKILGQVMLKAKKEEIEKELQDKKRILQLRLNALDRQEEILRKKLKSYTDEVGKKLK